MTQQSRQMRIGACKAFAYDSVELVLLVNGNRYGVDYKTLFQSGQAHVPTLNFLTNILVCSLWSDVTMRVPWRY